MNSDVPHNSNLVSELHRNYLFKFKIVSSVRSNRHMMAPFCERITNLFGLTPAANMVHEIVQLQSGLNDDYSNVSTKIKHELHFRANN